MNKKFTVAIIGLGGRGYAYSSLFKAKPDEFKVTAICDFNEKQITKINQVLQLPTEAIFTDETEFFKEKRADVLALCTWDKDHVRQCITAMRLGYDVLLEKPVSDSIEELNTLLEVQKETGKKVIVCHVLRYGVAYRKLSELIKDGTLGTLMAIDAVERVAYWHQAQAYVRIQSSVNEYAHPTILAKCCHDLDYIQHFAGAPCDTVSSVGGLRFFRPENAPANAAKRCLDCPHIETCPYSAKRIYIDGWKQAGCPSFTWPYNKVSLKNPNTEEDLYQGLESSVFGKCVFFCDVHKNSSVVDHQMVQMHFANGVDASLRMLFAGEPGRRIQLFGTHGEVVMDEITDTIEIKRYGEEVEVLKIADLQKQLLGKGGYGHGGGDEGLINDLYDILTDQKKDYTSLTESVESHLIGVNAEISRLNGGILRYVHES